MVDLINARFKMRGGTFADLTAVNEVPLDREIIVEVDTSRIKIGDGVTNYVDLNYSGGGGTSDPVYYREPLSNGDPDGPSVLFSDGDIVFINQEVFTT